MEQKSIIKLFDYWSPKLLKINLWDGQSIFNEVTDEEQVSTDNFEIILKGDLNMTSNEKDMEKDMDT